MLTINGTNIAISNCTLDGYISEGKLIFGVKIEGSPCIINGIDVSPVIECESLFVIETNFPFKWPVDICHSFHCEFDENDDGEPFGYLYIDEHFCLSSLDGSITLDGNIPKITLCAKTSIDNFIPGMNELIIEISADINFIGFWFGKNIEDNWQDNTKEFIDLSGFHMHKTIHNVNILTPNTTN